MCLRDQVVRDTMRGTSTYPQGLTTTVEDSPQEIGLRATMTTAEIGLLTLICVVLYLILNQFCPSIGATPRRLDETLRKGDRIAAPTSGEAVTLTRTATEIGLLVRIHAATLFRHLLCLGTPTCPARSPYRLSGLCFCDQR